MNQYSTMSGAETHDVFADFRSDTVTLPSTAMKDAAMACALGDDVYGEDPTVNCLEATVAELLGKEAAVLFPTGTQSNLAAVMSHCERGDEVLIGDQYHVFQHEARGASVLGGVAMQPISTDKFGNMIVEDVIVAVKADDPHFACSKLLSLENTVSGCVIETSLLNELANSAHKAGLAVHLDGARLFNAVVAGSCTAASITENVDSVSICLSKGLGAPAGSLLAGSIELMKKARRHRKILGGSMRQAGMIAACGQYALENNVDRLAGDHGIAKSLAAELAAIGSLEVDLERTQTNMVFVKPDANCAASLREYLYRNGVNTSAAHPYIRMVVHMGITEQGAAQAVEVFKSFFATR